MHKPVYVEALPGFRLHVKFSDGLEGIVSLADDLYGPMFESLNDPDTFRQVALDEFGAVCWPNGADLDPYALYVEVKQQTKAA